MFWNQILLSISSEKFSCYGKATVLFQFLLKFTFSFPFNSTAHSQKSHTTEESSRPRLQLLLMSLLIHLSRWHISSWAHLFMTSMASQYFHFWSIEHVISCPAWFCLIFICTLFISLYKYICTLFRDQYSSVHLHPAIDSPWIDNFPNFSKLLVQFYEKSLFIDCIALTRLPSYS